MLKASQGHLVLIRINSISMILDALFELLAWHISFPIHRVMNIRSVVYIKASYSMYTLGEKKYMYKVTIAPLLWLSCLTIKKENKVMFKPKCLLGFLKFALH